MNSLLQEIAGRIISNNKNWRIEFVNEFSSFLKRKDGVELHFLFEETGLRVISWELNKEIYIAFPRPVNEIYQGIADFFLN